MSCITDLIFFYTPPKVTLFELRNHIDYVNKQTIPSSFKVCQENKEHGHCKPWINLSIFSIPQKFSVIGLGAPLMPVIDMQVHRSATPRADHEQIQDFLKDLLTNQPTPPSPPNPFLQWIFQKVGMVWEGTNTTNICKVPTLIVKNRAFLPLLG